MMGMGIPISQSKRPLPIFVIGATTCSVCNSRAAWRERLVEDLRQYFAKQLVN